jgi:murein DD-endopeptidase MepM/ murein hydrolase activator NlpD
MFNIPFRLQPPQLISDFFSFSRFFYRYIRIRGYYWFSKFESMKDVLVDLLYKRRGKYSRPFLHFGIIGLTFMIITFGPLILKQTRQENQEANLTSGVLDVSQAYAENLSTNEADLVKQYRGGEVYTHRVENGETLSSIAGKYGLKIETLMWENDLAKNAKLKPGQDLRILPVDGVRHKVQRGETIYTIAKKYGLDESEAQGIVDYPFNEFKDKETFELTVGQIIMVPNGAKPDEQVAPKPAYSAVQTPDAGSVTASGSFAWPASGRITQRYSFYHKAFDIANHGGGNILASDGGTVVTTGWDNTGYGNKIMIDHGNGFVTLYGHLSVIQVRTGQRVNRGDVIGQMGSTGRSTGTHLHFEIRVGGVGQDPGRYLK